MEVQNPEPFDIVYYLPAGLPPHQVLLLLLLLLLLRRGTVLVGNDSAEKKDINVHF